MAQGKEKNGKVKMGEEAPRCPRCFFPERILTFQQRRELFDTEDNAHLSHKNETYYSRACIFETFRAYVSFRQPSPTRFGEFQHPLSALIPALASFVYPVTVRGKKTAHPIPDPSPR